MTARKKVSQYLIIIKLYWKRVNEGRFFHQNWV